LHVENPQHVTGGIATLELDGVLLPAGTAHVTLQDDGGTHRIHVVLGRATRPTASG
jgi:cyclic beta-1,2-glucan synthetase